jgi:hypothetical protein
MAIPRGYRFDIEFDEAFPQGLVLIGDVAPDNEYQMREDKATGRPVRQKIDQVTGKRQWKATVTDPDEPTAKRASFEITLIAEVQPVPTTTEVLPGMRPIRLNGLTAEPLRKPESRVTASSSTNPTFIGPPGSRQHPALAGLAHHSPPNRAGLLVVVSSSTGPRESGGGSHRIRPGAGCRLASSSSPQASW